MTHPTDQPLPLPEPFAHICVLPTKDAGPTTFFTAPSDPRGVAVYTADQLRAHVAAERERWAAELARLRADNENLRSVMIAAAEEILEHWDAHCDADGYGPANLMHRLEAGIPSEYGYKAGDFARLRADLDAREKVCDSYADENQRFSDEIDRLRAEVEELRQRFRTYSFGQVVRLSDPEMKATVDAIKRRIKEEPGFGKALLQSAGILDAKGGFAEMYADAALTNRND